MIAQFEKLREDEKQALYDAPVLVAILIAGADGNIDTTERREAISIAQGKQTRSREQLLEYYQVVSKTFEEKFNEWISKLPSGNQERTAAITTELRKLNFIFPKIDKSFAISLHGSLKDLAKKIAEASGGVLGYLSVSYEEAKLMELKMINDPSLK